MARSSGAFRDLFSARERNNRRAGLASKRVLPRFADLIAGFSSSLTFAHATLRVVLRKKLLGTVFLKL